MGASPEFPYDDPQEREALRKRRYMIDTAVNWVLFVWIALGGLWIVENHVDFYQGERLGYKMLRDGVQVHEAESPYMRQCMERNLAYKDASPTEFFLAKWKFKIPVYIFCILLPIIVALGRVISRNRRRWNWAYYPFMAMGVAYFIYFVVGYISHLP